MIEVINIHQKYRVSQKRVVSIVETLIAKEEFVWEEATFIFSDDKHLNELKKEYFGQDQLTDTISFNLNETGEGISGEVYISLDRVRENAAIFKTSFRDELVRVICHSTLHLGGYEDTSSQEQIIMKQKEDYYLKRIRSQYLVRKT